ncbi:hypothetical protein ACFSTC_57320 [Nonomuraea ferruginea]
MNDEIMRAAAFAEFGGPEVLRVMELPAPQAEPRPGARTGEDRRGAAVRRGRPGWLDPAGG